MFKTGELSKLFKIDRTSLNQYVRLGLLNPVVLDNQYHQYSFFDMLALSYIRYYRGLGFSTNQIKYLVKEANHDEKGNEFEKRFQEIDQEIKLLQLKQCFLDYLQTSVKMCEKYQNKTVIAVTQGYYFLKEADIEDPVLKALYKLLPSNEFEVEYDEQYNVQINNVKSAQGLKLKEEWIERFGIKLPEKAIYYPPVKKCLTLWRVHQDKIGEQIQNGLMEIERTSKEQGYQISRTFLLHILINGYHSDEMFMDAFAQFQVVPLEE